jgi:cytochrome P450
MFEKMAEKLRMRFTLTMIIRILILVIAPKIAMMIGMSLFDPTACAFFKSIIQRTIKHRDENPKEKRDDFLQLMLEAKAGQLKSDAGADAVLDTFEKEALLVENEAGKDEHANVHEHAHAQKEKPKVILNDDAICAQSVLFLFGGFDTMQTLLQFGAYHLALDSDIQNRLAEEVDNCWKANGGKFTYDTINTLEYMDKFIMETLRMYPPLMRFDRECTKDYKIPGTDLVIPTGMGVIIPTYAIHHDPEIYPEPEKFDPERFSKEGKATRSPYAFMPFGHGPKNCIGMRFALTEAKLAFAHLIHNFKLEPSAKTLIPMKLAFSFNMKPDGDMWLKLSPRK